MDMSQGVTSLKRTLRSGERKVKRTYEPLWRYGFNYGPTKAYRSAPPVLNDEAKRVLADVDRDGIAVSTLSDLTGDDSLLGRLQEEAARLEAARHDDIEARRARLASGDVGGAKDKEYFIELLHSRRPVIEPDSLLAQVALNTQLRGVADHYYGLHTRVSDLNLWRNLPTELPPRSSQLWHRDLPEDFYILKLFVYLEDCEEPNGPFNYLAGTHGKGDRKLQLPSQFDGQTLRADDAALVEAGVLERRRINTGKAGALIFADTVGWHKGGWVREDGRLLFHALYASRAAHPNRKLGLPRGVDAKAFADDLNYDTKAVADDAGQLVRS